MAAEIERELIFATDHRGSPGKESNRAKLGRSTVPGKSKHDAFQPEIEVLLGNRATQKFIAERYSTTETNLHNRLKKRGISRRKAAG